MTRRGAAWQNGHAERLMRTIKEEKVYLSEYRDFADAQRQIGRFLDDVYMHKRIHSALGYRRPSPQDGLNSVQLLAGQHSSRALFEAPRAYTPNSVAPAVPALYARLTPLIASVTLALPPIRSPRGGKGSARPRS
jgi:transposase InsO family protein